MFPYFQYRIAERKRRNKEFYSALVTISVTVLSIMVAFYGISVVFLSGQAQQIRLDMQTGKANITDSIRETNEALTTFVYLIEPQINASDWFVTSAQQDNIYSIFSPYNKINESFSTLTSFYVDSLLGNYSEAEKQDAAIRVWLNSLNITRFKASYNLADFSLHDITNVLYDQFPPPPAYRNSTQAIVFLDSNANSSKSFTDWFNSFSSFYNDVSAIHSKINDSITGISQSYSDGAKLTSQELLQAEQGNYANDWMVESDLEMIAYYNAMASYYPSVFSALDSIFSHGLSAQNNIAQYNLNADHYNQIYTLLEIPVFFVPILLMAVFGVVCPMVLLSGWFEKYDRTKWCAFLTWISIIGFLVGVLLGWYILGTQIAGLIPAPPPPF